MSRWSLPEQTSLALAVAAARLAILCTKQWRVGLKRTTRAPVFTGRSFCERQLGVRFILLAPQLATALFSRYNSNLARQKIHLNFTSAEIVLEYSQIIR